MCTFPTYFSKCRSNSFCRTGRVVKMKHCIIVKYYTIDYNIVIQQIYAIIISVSRQVYLATTLVTNAEWWAISTWECGSERARTNRSKHQNAAAFIDSYTHSSEFIHRGIFPIKEERIRMVPFYSTIKSLFMTSLALSISLCYCLYFMYSISSSIMDYIKP